MQMRMRTYGGAIVVLSGLPAWVEAGAQTSTASSAASASEGTNVIKVPDPGWFIAGFVAGVVVGAIGAKVFGGSKSTS